MRVCVERERVWDVVRLEFSQLKENRGRVDHRSCWCLQEGWEDKPKHPG